MGAGIRRLAGTRTPMLRIGKYTYYFIWYHHYYVRKCDVARPCLEFDTQHVYYNQGNAMCCRKEEKKLSVEFSSLSQSVSETYQSVARFVCS